LAECRKETGSGLWVEVRSRSFYFLLSPLRPQGQALERNWSSSRTSVNEPGEEEVTVVLELSDDEDESKMEIGLLGKGKEMK